MIGKDDSAGRNSAQAIKPGEAGYASNSWNTARHGQGFTRPALALR
jgi:hypothetical protein